ncbi:MAG TPA: type I-U CRISPR-associated protein Csx17 [Planctomycetaceae bacterium]|nr:type I-U CRISPR-associated protein Csx17 [Planctomycetaceae bacterium]HQZ65379.1 type I-U CRISPR-associated protein Csx17 [Planctomycetaceae bacterium]
MTQHILLLHGCTPEPLMNYLKALGILRIVSEQADASARGCWKNGVFELHCQLSDGGLLDFFVAHYSPTPIVSPWNGDGGFLSESGACAETMKKIEKLADPRLDPLRAVIASVRKIGALRDFATCRERAKELEKRKKAKTITGRETDELAEVKKRVKEIKNGIVISLRNDLSDQTQAWLDACMVIDLDGFAAAPVLGSGGVDGRMEFSANFMANVLTLLSSEQRERWIEKSVFDRGDARLLGTSIGQFAPGRIGGPNATQGMEGSSSLNPCDYVLMLEGVVLLGGSVSRRLGQRDDPKAAFPFTVRASSAGHGSLAASEAKDARGELWLPLWERPASLAEIATLFAEGRSELAGRQSRTAVDFARAVASLGVDRGISSFTRQGFLKRNGLAFLATPLGRFDVRVRGEVELIREVDPWLNRLRMACGDDAPSRFRTAARCIDATIFDYCRYGGREQFSAILRALGQAERELANGDSFRVDRKTGRSKVPPLMGLSSKWIEAANDGSLEFRLALSLASMFDREQKVGPLRANLEPFDWSRGKYADWATKDRRVVWNATDLASNLSSVVARRLMDATRLGCVQLPLESAYAAPLDAVATFLIGDIDGQTVDDERIEELLWGLMLVDHRSDRIELPKSNFNAAPLPRAYALLKLLFLPAPLVLDRTANGSVRGVTYCREGQEGLTIRPEPQIIPLLQSGRPDSVGEACRIAARRLRVTGINPLPHRTSGGRNRDAVWEEVGSGLDGRRLAASLLFPLAPFSISKLFNLVARPDSDSSDADDAKLVSSSLS